MSHRLRIAENRFPAWLSSWPAGWWFAVDSISSFSSLEAASTLNGQSSSPSMFMAPLEILRCRSAILFVIGNCVTLHFFKLPLILGRRWLNQFYCSVGEAVESDYYYGSLRSALKFDGGCCSCSCVYCWKQSWFQGDSMNITSSSGKCIRFTGTHQVLFSSCPPPQSHIITIKSLNLNSRD